MTDFEAHFAAVRERFKTRLSDRLEALQAAARARAEAPGDPAPLLTIRTVAHDLVGSSGTFGFPDLGEIAAVLEGVADHALARSAEQQGLEPAMAALVGALEKTIAEPIPA